MWLLLLEDRITIVTDFQKCKLRKISFSELAVEWVREEEERYCRLSCRIVIGTSFIAYLKIPSFSQVNPHKN